MHFRAACHGKIMPRCVPRRSTMAKCLRDALFGIRRWQDCAVMRSWPDWQWQYSCAVRSRVSIRGNFFASCISEGASDGKIASSRQDSRAMHPKSPANRRRRIHRAKILPGRAPFRCTGPLNHARREDLAIRRRTARAIATTEPPLWAVERGAGGFLSGGVTLPKECVVLWGVERWRQSWHQ